jgi:hypothetical protein
MPTKEEMLAEQRKKMEAQNAEAEARMNGSQPTPTQAENDSAKLGNVTLAELDAKEDHGAAEEKSADSDEPATYKTRTAAPKRN